VALRAPHLGQPPTVTVAYTAVVRSQAAILGVLRAEITTVQAEVETLFARHPAAQVYLSQPGLGPVLAARVLAEFGDDPTRYTGARARKNYAGTSPITRASGRSRAVHARHVHNDRLLDALGRQAFAALSGSPGSLHLLRPAPRPRHLPPRRTAAAREPPRRHPARQSSLRTDDSRPVLSPASDHAGTGSS